MRPTNMNGNIVMATEPVTKAQIAHTATSKADPRRRKDDDRVATISDDPFGVRRHAPGRWGPDRASASPRQPDQVGNRLWLFHAVVDVQRVLPCCGVRQRQHSGLRCRPL